MPNSKEQNYQEEYLDRMVKKLPVFSTVEDSKKIIENLKLFDGKIINPVS